MLRRSAKSWQDAYESNDFFAIHEGFALSLLIYYVTSGAQMTSQAKIDEDIDAVLKRISAAEDRTYSADDALMLINSIEPETIADAFFDQVASLTGIGKKSTKTSTWDVKHYRANDPLGKWTNGIIGFRQHVENEALPFTQFGFRYNHRKDLETICFGALYAIDFGPKFLGIGPDFLRVQKRPRIQGSTIPAKIYAL